MSFFIKQIMETEDVQERGRKMEGFQERKRWLFFGLPFTFTKYTIKEDVITVDSGLFTSKQNDCYMYKVQDVELVTTLFQKIFKLGTVKCYTGDTTDHQLNIENVRNAKEIKDFILEKSEVARMKRRTLNTLNIGADELDGADLADLD